MEDYIVRGTASAGQIRCFGITARHTVEEAKNRHGTSPVMTAALGRLLCGGAMMGAMMKGKKELLTVQIDCTGPAGGLIVTADANGHVKGYSKNPVVSLPASPAGKLDVGAAVNSGVLTVTKDIGLKEPYSGQVQLVSGEIAEDLTYYFATSEQTPSSVALGVLMNKDNTVAQAGGYIIQLMPGTDDDVITTLEHRLSEIEPVTALLSQNRTPEIILEEILNGFDPVFSPERIPVSFSCNCSKKRLERVLISLGSRELDKMIEENEPIEINCHFCNTNYCFAPEELKSIRNAEICNGQMH
jgi:molecular chaperone Hsp33